MNTAEQYYIHSLLEPTERTHGTHITQPVKRNKVEFLNDRENIAYLHLTERERETREDEFLAAHNIK